MNRPSPEVRKTLRAQCAAAKAIRERFGLGSAVQYLVEEKLSAVLTASDRCPELAAELPAFTKEIARLFTQGEIRDHLGRRRFPRIRSVLDL
jgi:hypothetical protein